ncbi:uncharacterized protein LOC118365398 [Oncorhynchus keta]|uniref:uncharacterized protein LOC118365398 n=1 Tax=Oncorhynchus keta TaxID=8018 RepID=UPI0015F7C946|nr:uncharacterized protein LOC118365398 [Oncorhynchus keta]
MEAAANRDISQMVDEQGDLLRRQHNQLAQLGRVVDEVLLRGVTPNERRILYHESSQPIQQSALCSLYFPQQKGAPTTERSKVAKVISLLTGHAFGSNTAIWERGEAGFLWEVHGAVQRRLRLSTGGQRGGMSTYSNYGRRSRLLRSSHSPFVHWQHPADGMTRRSTPYSEEDLREEVQTKLACRDDTLSLDALIAMTIRLDNLLWEHWHSIASLPLSLTDMSLSLTPWR